MSKSKSNRRRSSRSGRGSGTQSQQAPQFQPIEALPTLAQHIDGMLAADREQYQNLLQARPKPYILDDATVNRVITAFTTQSGDFWLFDEQLRRWLAMQLTDGQRSEVERLVEQMRRLRENTTKVLLLARELSKGTIEKVMAKSDAELGLDSLLKGFPNV